jgi:hypothetical protein
MRPILYPLTAALLWLASACQAARHDASGPLSLAEAGPAQAEFRALRARFFDADAAGRAALTNALGDFLTRFPDDPRTLDVRVYLVWARLGAGDPVGARRLLGPLLESKAGPRLDFARVADAAILARSGEALRALHLLVAMDGTLVDLDERFVYGEERARAAFTAGAYDEAITALLAWLVQAPLDRQSRARTTAATLLGTVPSGELLRALALVKREAEGETRSDQAAARSFLASTMARKLTELALERSDAELARRLLDAAPVTLRASPEGQRLLALASAEAKAPAVAGRAVGLLLSLSGSLERRRAAAVSAGITRVLSSARSAAGGPGVDLLVRYDAEDADAALAALAADGAALFVAGNDDETARIASARAEVLHIPLLLLRPLQRQPAPKGFTFVLGLDDGAVEQELIRALDARGRRELARVGPGGTSCDSEPEAPGKPRFPLGTWRKGGVDALLVTGDADCARDLAGEVKSSRDRLMLALGLDASLAYATLGIATFAPQTGGYPANAPSGGWYEALGHDAGLLAARALEALPSAGVAKRADVDALHEKARDALAGVSAELWTSGQHGFAGGRVLPRELTVTSGGPSER